MTPEGGYRDRQPRTRRSSWSSMRLATCPHCAAFSQEGAAPTATNTSPTGVVSYEIRNPIHDPVDLDHRAAGALRPPASFHPLAEQAVANIEPLMLDRSRPTARRSSRRMSAARAPALPARSPQAAGLLEFFAARGISRDQAMHLPRRRRQGATALADASQTQAEELTITGTPTFFLNGTQARTAPAGPISSRRCRRAGAR